MFEVGLHQLHQTGAVVAVDHTVVPRRGEVHDAANHDMTVLNDGSVFGVVNTENPDFGLVDDGRCAQSTKSSKACDGEGGTRQVLNTGLSIAGGLVTRIISAADCQMSMASTCFTTGT